MRTAAVVVSLGLALAACKGDPVKCEKAARNYAALVYWDKTEKALALLPAGERANARSKLNTAYETEVEANIDSITSQCVSAGNEKMVDCMIDAKTAPAALKCAKLADKNSE